QYSVTNVQSGLSLDVASNSLDHGAKFQLWSSNGGNNQKFAFIPADGGYHRITPVHSNKPADVTGVSTGEGVQIQQWRYITGSHQQWRLEPVNVTTSLVSFNFPDRKLRHSNYRLQIDQSISPAADANFKMVAGLSDARGVSFESVNFPGRYLSVRSNGEVWL